MLVHPYNTNLMCCWNIYDKMKVEQNNSDKELDIMSTCGVLSYTFSVVLSHPIIQQIGFIIMCLMEKWALDLFAFHDVLFCTTFILS